MTAEGKRGDGSDGHEEDEEEGGPVQFWGIRGPPGTATPCKGEWESRKEGLCTSNGLGKCLRIRAREIQGFEAD